MKAGTVPLADNAHLVSSRVDDSTGIVCLTQFYKSSLVQTLRQQLSLRIASSETGTEPEMIETQTNKFVLCYWRSLALVLTIIVVAVVVRGCGDCDQGLRVETRTQENQTRWSPDTRIQRLGSAYNNTNQEKTEEARQSCFPHNAIKDPTSHDRCSLREQCETVAR